MELNEYQEKARTTANYDRVGDNVIYPTLGLVGEAGEVAEKIKKLIHKNVDLRAKDISAESRAEIIKELGDVLWHVATIASEFETTLEEVAEKNLEKLASRKDRGIILGSGDNR